MTAGLAMMEKSTIRDTVNNYTDNSTVSPKPQFHVQNLKKFLARME